MVKRYVIDIFMFSLQSYDDGGILPAEEAALKRALYASLDNTIKTEYRSGKPKRGRPPKRLQMERDGNVHDIATEGEGNEVIVITDGEEEEEAEVSTPTVESDVLLHTSLPGICSPACSEDDLSSYNMSPTTCRERSTPVSPVSQRSSSSLHLFVGSSSCQSSSCSSPSANELLSPGKEEGKRKRKLTKKKGNSKKSLFGASPLTKDNSESTDVISEQSELLQGEVVVGEDVEKESKMDGCQDKKNTKVSVSKVLDRPKDTPYQARRKFASNDFPPVRYVCVFIDVVASNFIMCNYLYVVILQVSSP